MQSRPAKQISSTANYKLHMVHFTYWILQSDTLALHQVPTLLLSLSCLNLHGFQSTCNPGWSSPVHLPTPSPCPHNLGNKRSCACEKELQILLLVITVITNFTQQHVFRISQFQRLASTLPNETCALLGLYAPQNCSSVLTFQDNLLVPSSRDKQFKNYDIYQHFPNVFARRPL